MQAILAPTYSIYFNEESYTFLNHLLQEKKYSKIFILVDENTNTHCLPSFISQIATEITIEIIEIEVGEIHKNIETTLQLWESLTELGGDRKSILLNLGGGVISDLGGFVAATFKRGIDCVHIPTTLLAMVDAAIGGKNGIDLGNLKNQIGVIVPPIAVLIDTAFLDTLPQNELRSGLAEMLKHGLIYDKSYWNKFKNLTDLNTTDLEGLIYESIHIKNTIVTKDPKEKGIRKALNFGHTLGHAIESYFLENANKKNLLHGEAIVVGMILESFISKEKNLLTEGEFTEIKNLLLSIFEKVVFEPNDLNPILELLIHDKKNEYGTVQFALLDGIGNIKINQTTDNSVILSAFEDYKTS